MKSFLVMDVLEGISFVWVRWRRQKLPLQLLIALCLNLAIAPAVYAAVGGVQRRQAWAIGLLGLVTLGLTIYLFDVVFRPERY
ncbi:potassium-transporting ATPase subunit F [Gloeocapsopsis sp. IPPAS B-1203]|uniref:potassium-transporting ATPase subunit F n=1 Tax=Gloeocapsopsis sp. IPPAS B-1203 TaxID=2049454 RepID=UPI0025A2DAE4|nr:potassium-transporting ATPase subunit F [Gloeocapsopsis sp. IPPAS B-1203]